MVQGASAPNPLIVFDGLEHIPLFANQTHVICARKTRLGVGDPTFDLDICIYEGEEYENFTALRDQLFSSLGLAEPDKSLESLPRPCPWLKFSSVLVHRGLGGGAFGWIQIGVHHQTGEPLAVKTIRVGMSTSMQDLLSEVEVSLSFPVSLRR